jgi:hypothetical protein
MGLWRDWSSVMMETLWAEMVALLLARSIIHPNDNMFSIRIGRAMQITCILSALYAQPHQMVCCSRIG